MKRLKLLLILLIISISFFCQNELTAKDFNLKELKEKLPELLSANNAGTDFWITFNPCWESTGGLNNLKLYISSGVATLVTVEIQAKGYHKQQTTIPNDIIEFNLTPPLGQCYRKTDWMIPEPDSVYAGVGVHVYADAPFICYGVTRFDYLSDSYLAIPVSSLGKDYVVASWSDNSDNEIQYLPGYTGIVSPYDNNLVRFTLGGTDSSKTAGGQLPGETRTYTLYKGDVLLISSYGQRADLSGSRIRATKPVSVISSNFCAYVPELTGYCDYMMEMELPTNTWGKNYLYTPIYGRLKNSIIKIFAKEPGTSIFRDGSNIATLTTGAGMEGEGWFRMRADVGAPRPIVFSSDKPIYVEQYNCGQSDDNIVSDPFMMVLTPYEQFQKDITFNTPGIKGGFGFSVNYVNIIYASNDENIPDDLEFASVQGGNFVWKKLSDIDSEPGESFSVPVNGKNYKCKTYLLPGDGVYKMRANKPFGVYAYGFSAYDSYGHPASVSLNNLGKPDSLPPKPTWRQECNGEINNALVEDMPQNNDRSNLSQIIFNKDESYNYKFSYEVFIPGEDAFTKWVAWVMDTKKDAHFVVTFSDMSGNDTTIEENYGSYFLNIKPDVDFGKLKIGDTVIKEVCGYNEQTHQIKSDSIILKSYLQGFDIINTDTSFILEQGDSVLIQVRFIATNIGEFTDSLGNRACPHQSFYSAKVQAIVDTVNSVEDEYTSTFSIYPTPADNFIFLKNIQISFNETLIRIYDICGIKIFEEKIPSSRNNLQICTAGFSSGIYYLQIINNKETITRKFCVVR